MTDTVAIIGAGIGGIYLAAELGRRGCRLRLHDRDDSRLAPIRDRGARRQSLRLADLLAL